MRAVEPFTVDELRRANREWGCNCGPSALAFACQVPLEAVRHAIPGFAEKRYTNPTMMEKGLEFLGRTVTRIPRPAPPAPRHEPDAERMFAIDAMTLVRVQWTGPWTAQGANHRWAYPHTHWIACWLEGPAIEGPVPLVFCCNLGVCGIDSWSSDISNLIREHHARADGGWFPTHIWRVSCPTPRGS